MYPLITIFSHPDDTSTMITMITMVTMITMITVVTMITMITIICHDMTCYKLYDHPATRTHFSKKTHFVHVITMMMQKIEGRVIQVKEAVSKNAVARNAVANRGPLLYQGRESDRFDSRLIGRESVRPLYSRDRERDRSHVSGRRYRHISLYIWFLSRVVLFRCCLQTNKTNTDLVGANTHMQMQIYIVVAGEEIEWLRLCTQLKSEMKSGESFTYKFDESATWQLKQRSGDCLLSLCLTCSISSLIAPFFFLCHFFFRVFEYLLPPVTPLEVSSSHNPSHIFFIKNSILFML